MNISELIEKLEAAKNQYGDVSVVIPSSEYRYIRKYVESVEAVYDWKKGKTSDSTVWSIELNY